MWKRWLIGALSLVAVLAMACGSDEDDVSNAVAGAPTSLPATAQATELIKVSFALDWFPNSNHAGIYEAVERGFFVDEGLDVNIYVPGDPSVVLSTIAAGQDDFGVSYQSVLLQARSEGVPVVSVTGIVQHPLNSVMALEKSGITRPGDLKGKKVGFPGIVTDEGLLAAMLAVDGLTLDDVQMVNVGFDLTTALASGAVDAIVGAYWTHESILLEQEGFDVTVLRMEEWGVPDFYELIIAVSEDTIANRPDVVQSFVNALQRGHEAAIADPQGSITTLIKHNPDTVVEDLEREGIERVIPMWTEGAPEFGWQEAERWEAFTAWMKDQGLVSTDLDAAAAFTNEFVDN